MLRLLTACVLLVLTASLGSAHEPGMPFAEFFNSLKQPGSGASCCSIADCSEVEYRLATDGYEALLENKWVHIPDQRVLHGQPNPTARGIACRSPVSGAILCFVPASEA